MSDVALILVYNHQFNKNIEILERIYKERFTNIYHLVPFYNGDKENVIPVYECSFFFQGYIAQGFKSFFKQDFAHYFFVADDLLLNPVINERNYTEHLKLRENTSFIPGFINLHERGGSEPRKGESYYGESNFPPLLRGDWWPRVVEAYRWRIKTSGVEAESQLPDYQTAVQKFEKYGLTLKPLPFKEIWKTPRSFFDLAKIVYRDPSYFFRYLNHKFFKSTYTLSYPIVGSYADICVVSARDVKQFCHYCGVFAATKLHVELALPTALVLAADEIVSEKDLKLQGKAFWTKKQLKEMDKYGNSFQQLTDNFPSNYLYIHPIKLSKWTLEL